MYCMKCGTKLPEDSEFCFKCGTKAIKIEETENNTILSQNSEKKSSFDENIKVELDISKVIAENREQEGREPINPYIKKREAEEIANHIKTEDKSNTNTNNKKYNFGKDEPNIVWPLLLALTGAIIGISFIGTLLEMIGTAWFVAIFRKKSIYTGWKKWGEIICLFMGLIILLLIVSTISKMYLHPLWR